MSGDRIYRPTADEITAGCQRIQATWSPEERERRRLRILRTVKVEVDTLPPLTVPIIRLADMGLHTGDSWE